MEEGRRVLRYEPVMKQYNLALTCSQEDLEYLQQDTQRYQSAPAPERC